MNKIIYDARWGGDYGIARYARETRKRLTVSGMVDIHALNAPLSPLGITAWEIKNTKHALSGDFYYSPSFTPAVVYGSRQAITIHDLIHIDFDGENSLSKKFYYDYVVLPVVKKAGVIFTVSEFSKDIIADWSGVSRDRIVVTGNAPSEVFTHDGPKYGNKAPYILYVGNTKPHKNFEFMMRLMNGLNSDIHLVIVSKSTREINRKIAHYNLMNRCFVEGSVSETELASLYRGAAALVIPSYYEGFGLPALEAMACGTPVIAANTTSLPEVLNGAGLLFDPTDVDEALYQLKLALYDSSVSQSLVNKGIMRASDYTWEGISEVINTSLVELVNDHS